VIKKKSIRERKVEDMLKEKVEKEDEIRKYVFKANKIPKTTTEPLY
jgi:Uncharacterised protein family UPF0564